MKKLNLASGQRPFKKPWVNVDIKEQGYPVDILTDIKDLSMIPDESVDVIVLHHVVEHIAIHELSGYIREWRRVLKVGGRLAVFVPDLKKLDRSWLEGTITTFIHNVNTYGAFQNSIHDLHKWGYDEQELRDRISGKSDSGVEFEWGIIRGVPTSDVAYAGADLAIDWWILSLEFVK